MYQSVRRVGKRFITSKLNGGADTQQERPPSTKTTTTGTSSTVENWRVDVDKCYFKTTPICNRSLLSNASKLRSLSVHKQGVNGSYGPHYLNSLTPSYCRSVHTVSNGTLLSPNEIEDTLTKHGIAFHKGFTGFLVDSDSCCNSNSSSYKTFINHRTGNTVCRGCGTEHSWQEFLNIRSKGDAGFLTGSEPKKVVVNVTGDPESVWSKSSSLDIENISSSAASDNYLHPAVTLETFNQFNVHLSDDGTSLLFPFYDISGTRIVKCVAYDRQRQFVEITTHCPSSTTTTASLFGWNSITDNDTTVVLTTSELDAISVRQVTGLPSLSISSVGVDGGTDIALPPSLLPFLEQFDRIILWFPDTYRDQENLQSFARKLDLRRCWKVTCSQSPQILLLNNSNNNNTNADDSKNDDLINSAIANCQHMSHDRIITFKDMRTELYHDLMNSKMNAGVPFTRFPALNEYLKGHRRGELTVFTGPTGSGKTTFLSELSLDLCLQGVKTLWGSFEIKNVRLLNTLMHQYAGFAVEKHMNKFVKWSEKFESLPLYFMSYYGAQDLREVLKTIEYSVYAHDIEHVIIDNLQFMTSTLHASSATDDRFLVMDRAIAAFRRCASDLNIHITVVVHPRKENDGGALQTASIYGSAKASQEADNVLILQRSDQLQMQITKNRFSGTVGVLPLSFHPESLCLSGFHRNVESEEEILPALKIRRPVSNVKIYRKNDSNRY